MKMQRDVYELCCNKQCIAWRGVGGDSGSNEDNKILGSVCKTWCLRNALGWFCRFFFYAEGRIGKSLVSGVSQSKRLLSLLTHDMQLRVNSWCSIISLKLSCTRQIHDRHNCPQATQPSVHAANNIHVNIIQFDNFVTMQRSCNLAVLLFLWPFFLREMKFTILIYLLSLFKVAQLCTSSNTNRIDGSKWTTDHSNFSDTFREKVILRS